MELPSRGLKYIWSNGRDDDSVIRAKLDRSVANADLFKAVWTQDIRSHWVVNHAWTQENHWRLSTRLSHRLYHTRKCLSL